MTCQPEYVIKAKEGDSWEVLDKEKVDLFIKRLIRQDMNSNNLFLLENLAHVLEKCMKEVTDLPSVRIHRVKDYGFI